MPDPVLVLDADGALVAANLAAAALLGGLDGAVGRTVGEALDMRRPGGSPALRGDWIEFEGEVELTCADPTGATSACR